ncbi:MAG: hypothetical protein SWQ30_20645 [Thermodesulfobacteriota bacterium]|nr:hypothetical protein [Thermodesulfobacteriota bacterium]
MIIACIKGKKGWPEDHVPKMLAWVREGGKIHDAKGETKCVHVYWKEWNYLPEGDEAIW